MARARAAVDLACALDPPPPSFDVADLLLSLHPMAQLQDDDDGDKITISLIEAAEPWTNPGRLGQCQADLAWLEDSATWTGSTASSPRAWPWHSSTTAGSPASRARSSRTHPRLPVRRATRPGPRRLPCWPPGQVNPILTEFLA